MKKINKKLITKKMTFAELIEKFPKAAMELAEQGLFCGGCPMAQLETIEQGAKAHGIDADELIKKLNKEAGR
jgi:hybrid cluster-associated redox disulfide protein